MSVAIYVRFNVLVEVKKKCVIKPTQNLLVQNFAYSISAHMWIKRANPTNRKT